MFWLTFILIGVSEGYAQITVWEGVSGNWFDGDSWSAGTPTIADNAVVNNGTTVEISASEVDAFAFTLTIGATVPGSTVQLADLDLDLIIGSGVLNIGPQGTFRFSGGELLAGNIQNDGTVAFDTDINHILVDDVTGSGQLIMEGTGILTISSNNTYSGATIVSAGTLQAGSATALSPNSAFTVNSLLDLNGFSNTIGSLAGNGIVTNSGGASATLAIGNDNTSTTFGGSLQDGPGTLGLTKIGTGTLTLTGLNTYTGGTNLNGGILAVNSDLNLGAGPLSFNGGTLEALGSGGGVISSKSVSLAAGGGTFLADAGTTSALNGLISGPGAWTKSGPGTLILGGANTYAGGTTIAGGTLVTQTTSALGTGPAAFGNGAALQVQNLLNANGNWTVSPGTASVSGGTVQTFGDFNLAGGGTLIVNANFNVPGAANINSSGFVVNSAFTANDDIDLNGGAAAVVNGLLTSPNVNVNNSSSLVVNAPGTVAANVNVGPSALLGLFGGINGSVVNAGLFQGTGVVNGDVVNSGIVSPGASIGTLTINGNYTQNPSGTLRVEVAGASTGQYDVLVVNGRANIAGRLQLVRVGNFTLQVGDQITFLTASGGVSGTFSNVENDFLATGSAIVFDVTYLSNIVILEAQQGSFAEFARLFCGTPNAIAVGEALDSAVGDPRASELIDFLNNEALTDLCEDIDLISPEQLTSIFVIGVSLANVQTANLERRMTDIRAGSSGFSGGFAINGSAPSFWEGFAGVSGPEGKSGPAVFAPVPQNRWGIFATGLGEFTNVDSTFNASGYDLATGGFTMGVDYRIGSNFAVGLTGGYAYTSADLVNESSIGVNGGKLGLYATAFGSGFYLDTAVIGGLSGYDTRRTALQGTARGETLGGDLNVLVAGGYDWKRGALTIGPTASFQYTLIGFDGFNESGSLAPLAYPSQTAESFRTAFGARASYDWKIGPAHIIPELRLAWQHEFGETDYSLVSSFASGAGNSFTVSGPEIGRDSMLIGAGFAIHWNDRMSTYAYYDGELFRTNFLSNNISAGFRLTF